MSFGIGSDVETVADQDRTSEQGFESMVIRCEISERSERIVIRLSGHFDIDHAAEVWRLLRESVKEYQCVLVDLHAVRHMDSAGLASLAEAHRLARQRHTAFALVGVNQQVLKMLKLSGLQRVLRLYPSVAKALSRLTSATPQPDALPRAFTESLARTRSPSLGRSHVGGMRTPSRRVA